MLTARRLRELLDYDPNTGLFRWKLAPGKRADLIGTIAGGNHIRGYLQIGVGQKRYLAHRLAWLFMTGAWPLLLIDHRDGDKKNNRYVNLREATNGQNVVNAKISKRNATGVRGVYIHAPSGRFRVQLGKDNHKHHIGYFDDLASATRAAETAAKSLHDEFARPAAR